MLGHKNSPQEPIKVNIASKAIVGFTIGRSNFVNIWNELHPSITALSSISFGIVIKAWRIKNIPKALTAKGKIKPKKEWVDSLVKQCDKHNVRVFMKESLRDLMGSDFRQDRCIWYDVLEKNIIYSWNNKNNLL